MKKWYSSKTLWFNAITLALALFDFIGQQRIISPEDLVLIMGVGNVFLRFVTSQALVKK